METKIIAVWGSPGCGKTVTAIKLARELGAQKKNVIVVLADQFCPGLEILLPGVDVGDRTLGRLLFQPKIRATDILQTSIPCPGHEYIALLGYKLGDNNYTYGTLVEDRLKEFFMFLRQVADYAVIDCSSVLLEDCFSTIALQRADKVFRLYNANFKSYAYFRGQIPLISRPKFRADAHVGVLSDVREGQEESLFRSTYGNIFYTLRHVGEVADQYDSGRLLDTLSGKAAKRYNEELEKIMEGEFSDA